CCSRTGRVERGAIPKKAAFFSALLISEADELLKLVQAHGQAKISSMLALST
ncbi:hypothetical protein Ancab_016963, partial [Ancistrocladus abbreviatus]